MANTMAYLEFLLAGQAWRIPMICSLNLLVTMAPHETYPATVHAEFYAAAMAVLRASTQLVDLKLGLLHDPDSSTFPAIVRSCMSLTHLKLEGLTYSKAANILSCIQTPMKSLILSFAPIGFSPFGVALFRVSDYIRKFTDTLEVLGIHEQMWTLDESIATQWPRMTILSVTFYPVRGSISAMFPALQNLMISNSSFSYRLTVRPENDWSHLSSALLAYDCLSRVIPSCVVERLRLVRVVDKDSVPELIRGLRHANPVELSITLDADERSMEYTTQMWEVVPRLQCLTLRLSAKRSSPLDAHVNIQMLSFYFTDFNYLQNNLLHALSALSLTWLEVEFVTNIQVETLTSESITEGANAMARAISSLKYISYSYPQNLIVAWKIYRPSAEDESVLYLINITGDDETRRDIHSHE